MNNSKDAAESFLNSLEFLRPKVAQEQIEHTRAAILEAEAELEFYLTVLQNAKARLIAIRNPTLLSRLEKSVELHRSRLAKLQLAFEMKKDYAVEVLKMIV